MGKLMVYLMDDDKPVCFWKGNCTNFINPDAEMKFEVFKTDLALGKVTENYQAGLIGMKISINNVSVNGPVRFEDYRVEKCWRKTL